VADSTKFGRTSLARLCELGNVDTLVVDEGITQHWRDIIVDSGVKLVVAPSGDSTTADPTNADPTNADPTNDDVTPDDTAD
jgi:DeoR family fructose operon transcriptional repressor